MATSLQTILAQIKATALLAAVGFKSVEEKKFNMKSNADTMLPKLFIKIENYTFDKFQQNAATENYFLELTAIIADSENPVSDLKTIIDKLLNQLFNENELFTKLAQGGKIVLTKCDVSNDRDLFSKYGGEYATLSMQISNVNQFGETPCM